MLVLLLMGPVLAKVPYDATFTKLSGWFKSTPSLKLIRMLFLLDLIALVKGCSMLALALTTTASTALGRVAAVQKLGGLVGLSGAILTFVGMFCNSGLMRAMRGSVVVRQPPNEHPDARRLVGGDITFDGIYLACSTHPQNRFVVKLMAEGIESDYIEIEWKTPADVVGWVKRTANQYHIGNAEGPLEVYEELATIDAVWDDFKNDKRINALKCPST